jgi:hypothetical protein
MMWIRGRHVVPVVVLYGLAAMGMFLWPGLVRRVQDHCGGLPALDVRGYWTAADATALLTACGDVGRRAYRDLALLDLVFPVLGGATLVLLTALLLRRREGRGWLLLLVPAIAMTVFDYGENVTVWTLLLRWPEVDPTVAAVGGVLTAVKRTAAFIAFTIPIVLGVVELVRAQRRVTVRSGP